MIVNRKGGAFVYKDNTRSYTSTVLVVVELDGDTAQIELNDHDAQKIADQLTGKSPDDSPKAAA